MKLLVEATRLFARDGYAATGTDAIVRAAGVTKRMLYHCYGDKAALFREVLLAQWQGFAIHLADALGDEPDPARALDAFFDFVAARPEFVRLVMWDGLQGGETSRSIWQEARAPIFDTAIALLVGAVPNKKQRAYAAQAVISLLGAVSFYFAYAKTIPIDAPLSPQALKDRRAHLHDLLTDLTKRLRAAP